MKLGKGTIIVITGSVLLLGGVAACKHGMHHGSAEERGTWMVEKVSKELELDSTQQGKLAELKDELLDVRKSMRGDRQQTRAEVLAMLQQPTLDRAKANAIVDQYQAKVKTHSPAIIEAMGDFYDSLNDEQRTELRAFVEDRMARHHGRHHWH